MVTRWYFSIWCLAGMIAITSACISPRKLVEQGRYDAAITKTHRKLAGKQNKSPRHVRALEEAFRKANADDLARVHALEGSGQATDWDKIFALGRKIDSRQALVKPLLPLTDKRGYEATFRMVNTEEILYKAKDNAVIAWYDLAQDYLEQARDGDFMAAREALEALENIRKYHDNYRDVRQLVSLARNLGTIRVFVRLENEESQFISPALEREILDLNLYSLSSEWIEFVSNPEVGQIRYEAVLRLSDIRVGPDVIEERETKRFREIEDGWQYVLDENGNVMKDSLGNDIKVERIVEVQATILETLQEKSAVIEGSIELTEFQSGRIITREPLFVEANFRHKAQRHFGDERALSKHEKQVVSIVPFPHEEEMILMAIDELKPRFLERLQHSTWL